MDIFETATFSFRISPSTRYRIRRGLIVFLSGEPIQNYLDSPDSSGLKPYLGRESCGFKDIHACGRGIDLHWAACEMMWYTAFSWRVVLQKLISVRDNVERHCGWWWLAAACSKHKGFQRDRRRQHKHIYRVHHASPSLLLEHSEPQPRTLVRFWGTTLSK